MGRKRSIENCLNWVQGFMWFVLIFTARISSGITNPSDVAAINNLYAALGYPTLPGWVPTGGDPCAKAWQGVACNSTNIISITLNAANLGGELGDDLGSFSSLNKIDLSNNHIRGSIPSNFPVTMQNIFLSDNQFSGSIPSSFSTLTQLSAMSLNKNQLTGEIPDAFQVLLGLINLDLSSNNLSGRLPTSMENLSSLTTLHLQNNKLSGTLNALQDLPLKDLNIENNLFNGPVPENLLTIPNFKKDGNLLNTTRSPLPSPTSSIAPPPAPPLAGAPYSGQSNPEKTNSKRTKNNTKRVVWISMAGVLSFLVLVIALLLFMPMCWRGIREDVQTTNQNVEGEVVWPKEEHQTWPRRTGLIPKPRNDLLWPLPPPQPPPPLTTATTERPSIKSPIRQISVKSYTIASLQQYTNSFSRENLIGAGTLGTVYRAELSNGKLLAIKKLDKRASSQQKDEEFLDLVNSIDQIRHVNVVELVGYCAEHGQRLLIYEYYRNGTLQDALHSDDEFKRQLTWNIRIRMALGAARALEYLHEVCEPPIIHLNFKSANILLENELAVYVSDCGLASLISSGSVSQVIFNQSSENLLTADGYRAPEFESGIYTLKSDVFSFGVVMLELLTGRKSHDRTRNRGEQFLVRWAIPRLHDIDTLSSMVDPSLNGKYPVKSLSHFADIISRCVQSEPEFRPPMSEVVQHLLQMIRRESLRRFGGN
ncbi:protein STRUBBELIG-RECEPTOR FAMILY 3-like [Actinidia eriantha]|uniref:protein STRUBBELIG-RECEPTOR FAMILY 3-like n=1 Tax=Actinidia eriantha TaxID=165200 RepID=UPI0025895985|nr:protein STRUBBELIG-RECEPTOR FAMILY 3-like [Actinidia eriantha]